MRQRHQYCVSCKQEYSLPHWISTHQLQIFNFVFRHFKKYSSLVFEFLPQLLFLILLFTYLAALMIIKWITYGPTNDENSKSLFCYESFYESLIFYRIFQNTPYRQLVRPRFSSRSSV